MSSIHPPSSTHTILANGVSTDLLLTLYSDQISISITQSGKLGTIITASVSKSPNNDKTFYDTGVLLGKRDDPLLSIYARQLIEKSSSVDPLQRSILLSIALVEAGRDSASFQEIVNKVLEMFVSLL